MSLVDVLVATALEMERNAVRDGAAWRKDIRTGVRDWEPKDADNFPDYLLGEYALADGGSLTIALAHPTRMGGNFTSNIVSTLVERLKPRCLAMCGVCAGNPSDVALGDVVIGNPVFQYDEGKRTVAGFEGDLFPTPMDIRWLRHAKGLRPDGLPSYGVPSQSDATLWLLERFSAGADPSGHPAYARYFPSGGAERVRQLEAEGLLRRQGLKFVLTKDDRKFLDGKLAYRIIDAPAQLPFAIKVGPMASGNAVVKDGVAWDMLKHLGQRSAIALEMEAATIGVTGYTSSLSKWIVVKGVMDHADPNKNDRYKPFAARASAEVLLRFLEQNAGSSVGERRHSDEGTVGAAGASVQPLAEQGRGGRKQSSLLPTPSGDWHPPPAAVPGNAREGSDDGRRMPCRPPSDTGGMKATWLHVSDFHFKRGDPYDRDVVLKALVRSVERFRTEEGRQPDLIFATGDIADKGHPDEYPAATAFFDALLAAAGVEKRRLFVIPGNHDVDRTKGKFLQRTLGAREEADEYFRPGGPALHIEQKQRAFADWFNRYFDGIRAFPEDTTCAPAEVVDTGGGRIGILPLNSAAFCQDDHDHGKLWIGRRCLDAAIDALKLLGAQLTIALVHHPLDWLHSVEGTNIRTALQSHVDIVLRGHLHETDVQHIAGVTGEALHMAAGASYQTRGWPNRALYATLDGGAIEIFPIRYEDSPREVWTLDTSLFPTAPYTRTFAVPRITARRVHAGPTWKPQQGPAIRSYIRPDERQEGPAIDEGHHAVVPPASSAVIDPGPGQSHPHPVLGPTSRAGASGSSSSGLPSLLPTPSGEPQPRPDGLTAKQLREDREEGFRKLKNEIVKVLKTSKRAMDVLTSVMPPSATKSAESSRSDERRAHELAGELLNIKPFEVGKEWLVKSYRIVDTENNQGAMDTLAKVSRYLVPWLYIAGDDLHLEKLEQVRLDDIIRLPAGLATFAEIVMAGIDRRSVQFEATRNPHGWPCSEVGVATVQPESGLTDVTDRNLRSDLFARLTVPSEFALRDDSEKDVRIQKRLEYFLTKERIRYYWICNVPQSDPDKSECQELVKRIIGRYPTLAVIELDQTLAGDHQDLFDEIRHLLHLVKP
jgi:nucleoside phosphorylase/predicted phosphodiesterase